MDENINPDESSVNPSEENNMENDSEVFLTNAELKEKWRKELLENPDVDAYLKEFKSVSVDKFLEGYLTIKQSYHTCKKNNSTIEEKRRDSWINDAYKHLNAILQKQLFDKQCYWLAEQIQIEGVEIAADFEFWSKDIFNCPFLSLITPEEIEMYQAFLTTTNLDLNDLNDRYISWQNYSDYKASYISNENDDSIYLPDWYEFHNSRTGNGSLLLMENVRGVKENFYIRLWYKSKESENRNQNYDSRPHISVYEEETVANFVNKFENKECQNKYKAYKEREKSYEKSKSEYTLKCIIEAGEPIPVTSHNNIIDAIEIAYNTYALKQISAHLPLAFEQYLLTKNMGFRTENKLPYNNLELKKWNLDLILNGRELNGEPRDLDF